MFTAFPFGTDPRGRQVAGQLFEHNWLIGAAPGQGKTSAVRVVACAAALDPLAELWIHELAGKGDLEPLAQVSHRYCSGLDDEAIGYAAESMRMLRAELDTRVAQAQGHPEGVPPGRQGDPGDGGKRPARLFPLVAMFDEVQNLFMHDEVRQPGRRRRGVRDPARPRLRHHPGAGHPAAGHQLAADHGLGERVDPVLPEGARPGRERHDPRHQLVQERVQRRRLPAQGGRRAGLAARRGRPAGGPDLLPGPARRPGGSPSGPGCCAGTRAR